MAESEEIDNLKRLIASVQINQYSKYSSFKRSRPYSFTREFHQTFKEELLPSPPKLLQKKMKSNNTSKLILRVTTIIPYQSQAKTLQKKKRKG